MSKYAIPVRLSYSRLTRVEIFCDFFGRGHSNGYWKNVIQRNYKVGGGNWRVGNETSHLSESMDTGVGASGAMHDWLIASNASDGLRQRTLDGAQTGLDLPAGEIGSVIGNAQFEITRQNVHQTRNFKRLGGCSQFATK